MATWWQGRCVEKVGGVAHASVATHHALAGRLVLLVEARRARVKITHVATIHVSRAVTTHVAHVRVRDSKKLPTRRVRTGAPERRCVRGRCKWRAREVRGACKWCSRGVQGCGIGLLCTHEAVLVELRHEEALL